MSGPTFPIGTMINEMFVLAFLVVVESVRLLLGQQHEPVSFIKLFMNTGLMHMQLLWSMYLIIRHLRKFKYYLNFLVHTFISKKTPVLCFYLPFTEENSTTYDSHVHLFIFGKISYPLHLFHTVCLLMKFNFFSFFHDE